MWFDGIPGVIPPNADDVLVNRMVAVACASRVKPADPANAHDATPAMFAYAETFEEWIAAAEIAADRYARRLALCLACEHTPTEAAKADILLVAKEIRAWLRQ